MTPEEVESALEVQREIFVEEDDDEESEAEFE